MNYYHDKGQLNIETMASSLLWPSTKYINQSINHDSKDCIICWHYIYTFKMKKTKQSMEQKT